MCIGYDNKYDAEVGDSDLNDFKHVLDLSTKDTLLLTQIQDTSPEAKRLHDAREVAPAPMTRGEVIQVHKDWQYSTPALKLFRRLHEMEVEVGEFIDFKAKTAKEQTDYQLEIKRLNGEIARLTQSRVVPSGYVRARRDSKGKFVSQRT